MDIAKAVNFQPFMTIHDPRLERKKLHKLFDILVITICAVLCGVDDWEHIAEFGRANEEWFRRFLKLPNGMPKVTPLSRPPV